MVWDFLTVFRYIQYAIPLSLTLCKLTFLNTSKPLGIAPFALEDFVQIMSHQKGPSVPLSAIFLSLLKLLLSDSALFRSFCSHHQRSRVHFTYKPKEQSAQEPTVYNGLRLLPTKPTAEALLEPLFWPATLSALLPVLGPCLWYQRWEEQQQCSAEPSFSPHFAIAQRPEVDSEGAPLGQNLDIQFGISQETAKVAADRMLLLDAFIQLNSNDVFALPLECKIAVLKTLCLAAYDTEQVSDLLSSNFEERSRLLLAQAKAERGTKTQRLDIDPVKRGRITEELRIANKKKAEEEMEAKAAKRKGKTPAGDKDKDKEKEKEKDQYAPSQAQLAAAIEEALFMEEIEIDVVLPEAPLDIILGPEPDPVLNTNDLESVGGEGESKRAVGGRPKRGSSQRVKTPEERVKAKDLVLAAEGELRFECLEQNRRIRRLREAIKFGKTAGLQGEMKLPDGKTGIYCTELLYQVW